MNAPFRNFPEERLVTFQGAQPRIPLPTQEVMNAANNLQVAPAHTGYISAGQQQKEMTEYGITQLNQGQMYQSLTSQEANVVTSNQQQQQHAAMQIVTYRNIRGIVDSRSVNMQQQQQQQHASINQTDAGELQAQQQQQRGLVEMNSHSHHVAALQHQHHVQQQQQQQQHNCHHGQNPVSMHTHQQQGCVETVGTSHSPLMNQITGENGTIMVNHRNAFPTPPSAHTLHSPSSGSESFSPSAGNVMTGLKMGQHNDPTYETSSPETQWTNSPHSPSDWSEGSPAGVVTGNHIQGHGIHHAVHPRSSYQVYPPQNSAGGGMPSKMQVA